MHLKWENPLSKPIKDTPQLTKLSGLLLNETTISYAKKSLIMIKFFFLWEKGVPKLGGGGDMVNGKCRIQAHLFHLTTEVF
jgi:hypothetical protein